MASGYFDLQVNGYGGVDFNQDGVTADDFHRACAMLREHGVDQILATICSETLERMTTRLSAIARHRQADPLVKSVIAGIHIEGPFFNENDGFRGAHPIDAMRQADPGMMQKLLDAGEGLVRMVTLAPERDPGMKTISMLARQKITVSAGHTDASIDDLRGGLDAGLTLFTHLGNGCPMLMNRHDNIIQRALSLSDRLHICFIADGFHIPFFALGNYLKIADPARCIVVTDAITPAGLGPGTYTMGRWTLKIGSEMVARSPDGSHLVGAVITMRQSEANLRRIGLSELACRSLLIENPRAALGLN